MRKRSLVLITIAAILLVILLSVILLFFISMGGNSRVAAKISDKCQVIKSYTKRSKMPLSEESVLMLKDERNRLKNVYSRFKLALASPLNEEISGEDLGALQFKERLIQVQKKLREDSARHDLVLPESLGFSEYETELSETSEIPYLLMRLKVLEELIARLQSSGIELLENINFADTEEADFYFGIPVSFIINCTSSRLVDLLYQLRSSSFPFVVEDMDIERIENAREDVEEAVEPRLKTSLSIKAIALIALN